MNISSLINPANFKPLTLSQSVERKQEGRLQKEPGTVPAVQQGKEDFAVTFERTQSAKSNK